MREEAEKLTEIESGFEIPFENFSELRECQKEALEFIQESEKRIIGINAPTGTGKSLIGMMAKDALGANALTYICSSKHLQDQLIESFPEAVVLKGRSNYPCASVPELTADYCTDSKDNPCEEKFACIYNQTKLMALASPYRVLNFHYWLTEANYIGRFSDQELVVIDEADMLESTLTEFVALTISFAFLNEFELDPPKLGCTIGDLYSWTQTVTPRIERIINEFGTRTDPDGIKQCVRVANFLRRLYIIQNEADETWIIDENEKRIQVKPLWLSEEFVQQYLLDHSQRFVMMSATLPPKGILSSLLNIDIDTIDYLQIPSTFPVESRRVHFKPVVNLSKKRMEAELPKLVAAVKEILAKHKDERILIHTVSYNLAYELHKRIRDKRLLMHTAKDKEYIFRRYLDVPNAAILSPSMERGVDLPDDYCRVIVWAKVPYPNLGDKFVSGRLHSCKFGKIWYPYQAIHSIIQGAGRGMRHKDDWCVTYILDRQFERLMQMRKLFPGWFMEAVVVENTGNDADEFE